MALTRKFLDWKSPALVSAAEFLIDRYRRAGEVDLSGVVAVTPGSRAKRQLLETLVRQCESRQLRLVAPRIETIGRLPELLFPAKRPYASDLVQQLVWVRAIQSMSPDELAALATELPARSDWVRWLEMGKLLWRLHRELAAEGLSFAKVVKQVSGLHEGEHRRWQVLAKIQQRYHDQLDALDLWDVQTARLVAIERKECATSLDIVLVAVADMTLAIRQMLELVADRVTALVFAPPALADRFDPYGCLRAEKWSDAQIPLDDASLRFVEGPAEQAACVGAELARLAPSHAAHEVVVGVPDEQLVPALARHLEDRGVRVHHAAGQHVVRLPPVRLLEAIAAYVQQPRFRECASLVRHPDMYRWLSSWVPPPWLADLDEYYSRCLPVALGEWRGPEEKCKGLIQIVKHVERLVAPLRGDSAPLGDWASPLTKLLSEVYRDRELDRDVEADRQTVDGCRVLRETIEGLTHAPAEVQPLVSAAEAVRIVIEQLRDESVSGPPEPDMVELLGWLDLPLDLAPAAVLTSLNEGVIPTSVNADLFLPNNLRRRLQLVDNQRRYARDAYALQALTASRPHVTLIVARRDPAGDPLMPSRLIFATDPETIARRILRLSGLAPNDDTADGGPAAAARDRNGKKDTTQRKAPATAAASSDGARRDGAGEFVVPLPEPPREPPDTLSVTAFRTYLACPYRFYLRYVLRLEPCHDEAEELDAAAFGNLLHTVLDRFGSSPFVEVPDAKLLAQFLNDQLDEIVAEQFGTRRLPAVNLQIRQLRARLDAFARWQADWFAQGWRIRSCEKSCAVAPPELQVPGTTIYIKGRIDRVDFNERTGEWAVLDYKSSDSGKTPRSQHQASGKWVDLQLPLYRHLAREFGAPPDAKLGYIRLPKDPSSVGESFADWTLEELAEADRTAYEVIQAIVECRFWPPATRQQFEDEFSSICQDNIFARQLARDIEELMHRT